MIVCRQSLLAGWVVLGALAYASLYAQEHIRKAKAGATTRPIAPSNVAAAASSRADLLTQRIPDGLGLSGRGVTVGIWDQAAARASHRDLAGRLVVGDTAGAADHSTHVAATIGGSGASQAAARGFAPEALLLSYDWSLDTAELRQRAPFLAVSVHAYGFRMGWATNPACSGAPSWLGRSDENEDRGFGKYGAEAHDIDAIAYEMGALTVWAAGNERQDVGASGEPHFHFPDCEDSHSDAHVAEADSGYDTIGLQLAAKNTLVVGASAHVDAPPAEPEEIAVLPFSSFGPMDDGRIKPDLVASGALIYSATSAADDAHASYSGTSSSAAVVGGAIALLTEHYRSLNEGADLAAEAMRALVVHSAAPVNEHGSPTYASGYGLLDATEAAQVISGDAAQPSGRREIALGFVGEAAPFEVATEPVVAGQAFRVSIAWTDPPGPINEGGVDDPAPALVNDLDLELIAPDGETIRYPWSLNRSRPGGNATRSTANRVDNIEVADVTSAMTTDAGAWTIRVSAHGSLYRARQQRFALVASVPFAQPNTPVIEAPRSLLIEAELGQSSSVITVPLRTRGDHESLAVEARTDAPWLSAPSDSVAAPGPLALHVESDGLASGLHYATVKLEHDGLSAGEIGVVVRVSCEPDCAARECGVDPVCASTCGACGAGEYCSSSATCESWASTCPAADLGSALAQLAALGTTQGESDDSAGSCGGSGADDVAFAWTAPEAGVYRFATDGSVFDTVLYVRDGGCDGAELGCNDQASATASALALVLEADQHVVVVVDGASGSDAASGDFHLSIQRAACADADLGSRLGTSLVQGSTAASTDRATGLCSAVGRRDAAFSWTAPAKGTYTFSAIDSAEPHTIHILSNDCSGAELGCMNDENDDVVLELEERERIVAFLESVDEAGGRFNLGVTSSAGMCAGNCDGTPNRGACFCDAACVQLGDCCEDACSTCGSCCVPQCDDRACGGDGCGGSCGTCGEGERCDLGDCIADDCAGLENGTACDDGDACTGGDRCVGGRCSGVPSSCPDVDAGTDGGAADAAVADSSDGAPADTGENFLISSPSCACSTLGARSVHAPSPWLIFLLVLGAGRIRRMRNNIRATAISVGLLIVIGCDSASPDVVVDESSGGSGGHAGDGAEMPGMNQVDESPPSSGPSDAAADSSDDDAGTSGLSCGQGECELLDPLSCGEDQACLLAIDEASQAPRAVCAEAGPGLDGDACGSPEDCSAGLDCTSFDGNGACRRYCCALNTTAGCPNGQYCRVALEDMSSATGVALCDRCDGCDLADAESCGADFGCYPLGEGCTACLPAGLKTVGERCELADDCEPGSACFSVDDELRCVSFCVQGSDQCPSGSTCSGADGLGQLPGICL